MPTKRKRPATTAGGQSGNTGKPATRSKGAPVKGSTGAKKQKPAAQVVEKTKSSVKTSKRENYDSGDPPPTIDMATAQAEQPLAASWLARDAARDAALGARRQGRLVGTIDVRFCCEPAVLGAMTKENDVPVTRKQFTAPVRKEDVYWRVDTGETYTPQGQLPLSRFLESLDTGDVELRDESHMEVLEALWALQFPKASPWKRPFIRLLTRVVPVNADGGDDGAEQDSGEYCVTFFVYVSRLIFELIGDSSCKTLLRALTPAGPVVPTTLMPEPFKMFKKTEGDGEEDEEYTLSGVLRAAESEGYKIRDPQPANLKLTMFEFQRSSYQWMLDQERDARGINYRLWEVRRWKDAVDDDDCLYVGIDTGEFRLWKPPRRTGGLLADEMGLGKTLMTISLILGNPKRQRGPLKRGGIESPHGVEESKEGKKGEVVKKEEPALDDDDAEIEANDRGEASAAAPHHYIPSRATLVVVPMTLLMQWRMEVDKIVDVKSTGFKTMIFSSLTVRRTVKLRDIRLLDAGEDAEPPTMADLAREKEVLVPWMDDLEENGGPDSSERQRQFFRAKVCSFNESNEEAEVLLTLEEMAEQDIVITSYDTLRQHGTFLKKFAWYRVVLDECHEIRTATTQVARLCSGLSARHRWMVSGTPLVGGIDDLHGELAFLNVWPFSLHNDGFWELRVAKPFKAKQPEALRLLHKLISVTMMRHSKAQTYLDGRPLLTIEEREPVVNVGAVRKCTNHLWNLLFEPLGVRNCPAVCPRI